MNDLVSEYQQYQDARLRKGVSSTRRKVSTTWSRRRPKRYCRSQPANLSVAKTFEHVGKISQSCIHTRVPREQDRLVTPFFGAEQSAWRPLPVCVGWRRVEAVGKAVSSVRSRRACRWPVACSSDFFRRSFRFTSIS